MLAAGAIVVSHCDGGAMGVLTAVGAEQDMRESAIRLHKMVARPTAEVRFTGLPLHLLADPEVYTPPVSAGDAAPWTLAPDPCL